MAILVTDISKSVYGEHTYIIVNISETLGLIINQEILLTYYIGPHKPYYNFGEAKG
jgi:hypothetical protein